MIIDVEKEFAVCVQRLNGMVLDDTLQSPSFKNADYWFPKENVVAELKRLNEDLGEKVHFKQKIQKLFNSWVRQKLMPPPTYQKVIYNIRDIPKRCADEFLEVIKKRFESSTIKQANSQIRETKNFFKAQNAKGLLILVQDGNLLMQPDLMAHLLARILKDQHTSMHSVIYFSANFFASVPNVPQQSLFWIDALVPNREPISKNFRNSLQKEWFSHVSTLTHGPVLEIGMPAAPEIVEQIKLK